MTAEVRRLTTGECGKLQGFPEGYLSSNGQGDSAQYSEAGNSWAVPNARIVIKGVHKVDEKLCGTKREFKYGTISSGVEAHTMASVGLGDKAVFYSEIAPAPCSVLNHHYPDVPNLGDMTLVDYDKEKKCIHNRPYEGYKPVGKDVLGFEPFKTPEPVEIQAEFGEVNLVSGGTPCWTKGAYVLTANGYKPIEDVKVGDKVVTHRGRLRKVLRVGKKMANNVVEVKASGRPAFKVTADHKFLTTTDFDNIFDFKSVSEIGVKGNICIPKDGFINDNIDVEFPKVYKASKKQIAELAGWYVGDGYTRGWKGKTHKAVVLCLNDEKVKKFESKFKGVINYSMGGRIGSEQPIQITNTAFANWLESNFGRGSSTKVIPAWIIGADETVRKAFLEGYMLTDGHTDRTGAYLFTTVSPYLAYGISDLMSHTSVGHAKMAKRRCVKGVEYNQHDQYYVRRQFNTHTKYYNRSIRHFGKYDLIRIMSISPAEPEEVYNIEVEEDHSYVCNGMMSSNCQDVSVAGKRRGATEGSGTRSALAFQLPRIGQAVGADYIIFENVVGIFSSNGGRDFAWLIHRMTEYGYKAIAWRTFDAQFCRTDLHPRAVPQRRRRVWIVGYRGDDWRVPCEALFEPMKVLGDNPPVRTVGVGFVEKQKECLRTEIGSVDELLEFNDFMKDAKENIIKCLVDKGVCISPEERRNELMSAKAAGEQNDGCDLFGGDLFGPAEQPHQGRGLKAKDLELNFPEESSITQIGLANLFQWAKTVCSEVKYCGSLFKCHEGDATVDDLDERMISNIGNAGFLCNGLVCTMKMPEWNAGVTEEELAEMPKELAELYDGDVCGLSDILEENPDPKYKLSWRACYGILKRAVNRKKMLPIELAYSLVERIIDQAPIVKWCAIHGKDVVAKEGQLSERAIAKIAFDDYIDVESKWVDVKEAPPEKAGDSATSDCDETDECETDEESNDSEPVEE